MVLGMSLRAFTLLHVLISLAGIGSGFVVLLGFLNNKRLAMVIPRYCPIRLSNRFVSALLA
jgi:hypothetical protein